MLREEDIRRSARYESDRALMSDWHPKGGVIDVIQIRWNVLIVSSCDMLCHDLRQLALSTVIQESPFHSVYHGKARLG